MKIRRKSNHCLNCGRSISEVYNYCPNCSQENTHHDLSFGVLFREFFSNYFSLDSRFGRSVKPFLFKPGHLTKTFNEGRRVLYAHPVRLYLVISLIHFSVFAWVASMEVETNVSISSLDDEDRQRIDSLITLGPDQVINEEDDNWPVNAWEETVIDKMVDEGFSDQEILDSLQIDDYGFWRRFGIKRYIRVSNSTTAEIQGSILKNIPVMMFFILPIYAMLLKAFYWRRGKYIHHLVHSFHIHSFAFLIFSFAWLVALVTRLDTESVTTIPFLIIAVYLFFSMKRVYDQKIWTTIWKMMGIGMIYSILLAMSILVELLLSLAFY